MDLEDDFSEAADFIQNHASSTNKDKKSLDDKVLLQLYGLYKVVTIGPCNESQPGLFSLRARAKWSAWKEVSSLSGEAAMKEYVQIVKSSLDWIPPSEESLILSDEPLRSGGGISGGMGNAVSSFAKPQEDDPGDAESEQNPIFAWAKDNDLVQLENWAKTTKNINIQDENGLSPLHWCVDRGYLELCRILLNNGADPELEDNEGSSTLEYAETCEHSEILDLLKQHL